MAIQQTTTTSFKVELLQGVHDFDADTFMVALYSGAASIGPDTPEYTADGEITGTGYIAGGTATTVSQTPTSGVDVNGVPVAFISFANAVWPAASFTARGALIYNGSKANRSVAVLDFGSDKTCSGSTFTVTFPVATADSAIVRIG
jgi:hypothetical protein